MAAPHRDRAIYTHATASTYEQASAEDECEPFFVELDKLPRSQLDHLREVGLLAPVDNEAAALSSSNTNDPFDIWLLRDKHEAYLKTIWDPQKPLRSSFVNLDASRTWMIYWCLHGADLLGRWDHSDTEAATRTVQTLRRCFTAYSVTVPRCVVDDDAILSARATVRSTVNDDDDAETVTFTAGGFGGGPDQLPHAATTYAAVLALCILASSHPTAVQWLDEIRPLLYPWYVSLHSETTGSFRMHTDGEIDVRATYCVVAVARLLHLVTPTLVHRTASYVASCQTWEGGFGGEPGAEAHGGYTYCAVAALELLDSLQDGTNDAKMVDLPALTAWLSRRQLALEGGFSGRANKLVDGCYSFWQGGAMTIVNRNVPTSRAPVTCLPCGDDPSASHDTTGPTTLPALFDPTKLERYILLCCQDTNGGLRDKPSKPRDFYHSCYCLSGLSMVQHYSGTTSTLSSPSFVHPTHPCYNIRIEHAAFVQDHFRQSPL